LADAEQGALQERLPLARRRWLEMQGVVDVHKNMALEEAIFWSTEGFTIRLWENQKSVIIGRGQYAPYETDLEYCISNKVPLVRRFTGGGAIYNGPGNVNWSLFVTEGVGMGPARFERGVREIFRMGGDVVIGALRELGIRAWLDAPNRIFTAEGKVSGMAAFLTKSRLLCHGTLLLNADLEEAQRLTKPRDLSAESRYVRSRHVKIANLGIEVASFRKVLREVLEMQSGRDGAELGIGGPTSAEIEMADKLVSKYKSREWNLGDPFAVGGRSTD
jgi:lipoate---protein ligase